MARKSGKKTRRKRRHYSREFKEEAVQMLLDGHSAASVAENLGLPNTNPLYSAIYWPENWTQKCANFGIFTATCHSNHAWALLTQSVMG